MAFRCGKCTEPQPPRTKPNRTVTAWHHLEGTRRQIKKEVNLCDPCVGIESKANGSERLEDDSAEAVGTYC